MYPKYPLLKEVSSEILFPSVTWYLFSNLNILLR